MFYGYLHKGMETESNVKNPQKTTKQQTKKTQTKTTQFLLII